MRVQPTYWIGSILAFGSRKSLFRSMNVIPSSRRLARKPLGRTIERLCWPCALYDARLLVVMPKPLRSERDSMRSFIGVLVGLSLVLFSVQPLFACSGPAPTIQSMADGAEVVAIGTVTDPTSDVITLRVEEYLKGALNTATLSVNNHSFSIADDCRMSLGPDGRFSAGGRFLVFLQPDEFNIGADWRPTGPMALHVLPIAADGQLSYGQLLMGTLAAARTQLTRLRPSLLPTTSTQAEGRIFLITVGVVAVGIGMVLRYRTQ
jgi:hypothetical protein